MYETNLKTERVSAPGLNLTYSILKAPLHLKDPSEEEKILLYGYTMKSIVKMKLKANASILKILFLLLELLQYVFSF